MSYFWFCVISIIRIKTPIISENLPISQCQKHHESDKMVFISLFISRSIPVGRYYFFPRAVVPGRSIFLLWRRSSMLRHPSSLFFMLTRTDSGGSSVSLLGSTPSRTGVVLMFLLFLHFDGNTVNTSRYT